MATERGWWKIEYNVEPNEYDLEHIGESIKQGYLEGEIVQDEPEPEFDEPINVPVKVKKSTKGREKDDRQRFN